MRTFLEMLRLQAIEATEIGGERTNDVWFMDVVLPNGRVHRVFLSEEDYKAIEAGCSEHQGFDSDGSIIPSTIMYPFTRKMDIKRDDEGKVIDCNPSSEPYPYGIRIRLPDGSVVHAHLEEDDFAKVEDHWIGLGDRLCAVIRKKDTST